MAKWDEYLTRVKRDFREVQDCYPFFQLTILPTACQSEVLVKGIAVTKDIVELTLAHAEDFCREYTKEIYIEIPYDYYEKGCNVYGVKWLKKEKFQKKDLHFFDLDHLTKFGYKMCVGTPESFPFMKNVLLENIRTADAMLVAYEKKQSGVDDRLSLVAYAHGDEGRQQFLKDGKRYIPR